MINVKASRELCDYVDFSDHLEPQMTIIVTLIIKIFFISTEIKGALHIPQPCDPSNHPTTYSTTSTEMGFLDNETGQNW